MNKKNILFLGHGKMIQGIINKFDPKKYEFNVTTNSNKQNIFSNQSLTYAQYNISQDTLPHHLIENVDYICFNIPPVSLEDFKKSVKNIKKNTHFIFTSSVSIYEKNIGFLDENSTTLDLLNKLYHLEEYIKDNFPNYTILRLGGLYGDNRHPIHSLRKNEINKGGNELIHLVHHDDVQDAIVQIIEGNISREIFNIISDLRITKDHYYNSIARKLGFDKISFILDDKTANNISNEKSKLILKMNYKNPLDYTGR